MFRSDSDPRVATTTCFRRFDIFIQYVNNTITSTRTSVPSWTKYLIWSGGYPRWCKNLRWPILSLIHIHHINSCYILFNILYLAPTNNCFIFPLKLPSQPYLLREKSLHSFCIHTYRSRLLFLGSQCESQPSNRSYWCQTDTAPTEFDDAKACFDDVFVAVMLAHACRHRARKQTLPLGTIRLRLGTWGGLCK